MPIFNISRAMFLRLRGIVTPDDNGKFWIAQIFMLASTVIGVYLAASIGFDRALIFDELTKKRTAFHMLSSLENEVVANNESLKEFNEWLDKLYIQTIDKMDLSKKFSHNTFVWNAMTESSEMFLISPEVINAVRAYYEETEGLVVSLDSNHMHRIDYQKAIKKIMEKRIPEIQALIKKDRKRLGKELDMF